MTSQPTALVVDLDNTLVHTDLMQECTLRLIRRAPLRALLIPWWLRRGIAYAKCRIAEHADVDVTTLPYRRAVLDLIHARRAAGGPVILATGTAATVANQVAGHLDCFDAVIATTGDTNCTADNKLRAVRQHLGPSAPTFDYVGDGRQDVPLWQAAARPVGVGDAGRFASVVPGLEVLPDQRPAPRWRALLLSLRPHHWVKNLLLFLPLLLAHRYADAARLTDVLGGAIAFSLLVSGTYLINDLFDLNADRRHTGKRHRPLAAGELDIPTALTAAAVLGIGGAAFIATSGAGALGLALAYVVVTLAYSMYFKHRLIVDVVVLASFYVLRILLGGQLAGVTVSFWLLFFSMLFFLNVALVKRYSELDHQARSDRAYAVTDLTILSQLGLAAGIGSVLVLGLYIDSPDVQALYRFPAILWLGCPLLIIWIGRLWLLAGRGQIDEDPVLFSIKDRATWGVAALAAGVVLLAR